MSKKDLNYIAKLEKAIEKKYGKKAIQHPKSDWDDEKEQEYIDQVKKMSEKKRHKIEKVEMVEKDGFLVSKKLLKRDTNRTCTRCNTYSFNKKDDLYMLKHNCCWECFVRYIEHDLGLIKRKEHELKYSKEEDENDKSTD